MPVIALKTLAHVLFWLLVTGAGFALSGCTTSNVVVLPSGQRGFTVDCSGTNLSWSHCYRKAGRACPKGYNITQKEDNHSGKPVPGNLYGVIGGSAHDRSLLIECRNDNVRPREAMPAPGAEPAATPATTGATTFPATSGA